jgi:oligopeptidase A
MQALRQLEFSLFDLAIHRAQPAPDLAGIQQILNDLRSRYAVLPTPADNRFQNSFSHIFAGGYAAGYYSYKWAEVLASDAFDRFEQEGIFNAQTGQAFRREVLAVGGSRPAQDSFAAFRGRPPAIEALLRHQGWGDAHRTVTSPVDTQS